MTMLKKILLATVALGFSGFALADPPYWAPAHGWRAHHHHGYYYAPRPVYVVPAPRGRVRAASPGRVPVLRGAGRCPARAGLSRRAGRLDPLQFPAVDLSGPFPPRD